MMGSPGAGAVSGRNLAAFPARVACTTITPAFLACARNAAMAGSMLPVHFGWVLQVGSIMSATSTAVCAGLRMTATGSGVTGICTVYIGLPEASPDAGAAVCASAAPPQTVNTRPLAKRTARIAIMGESSGSRCGYAGTKPAGNPAPRVSYGTAYLLGTA